MNRLRSTTSDSLGRVSVPANGSDQCVRGSIDHILFLASASSARGIMPSLAKVIWLWFLLTLGGVVNSEIDIDASMFSANLPQINGPGERAETVALLFCFEGVTISGMMKLALMAEGGEVRREVFCVVGAVDPLLGVPGPEYEEGGAGDVTGLG